MAASYSAQRGGTFLGIILGLLLGLGAALAVAIYVTKVPIPFINKGAAKPSTAEQDATEAQKNKNWDPNAPLYGKNPAKPSASGAVGTATGAAPTALPPIAPASAAKSAASAPKAAASAPKPVASAPKPPSADPLGDLAKAKVAGAAAAPAAALPAAALPAGVDPFTYFVQAGAFRTAEDAEAQKAKLGMAGFEAKVSEREQSGRTVFRVRVGPMDKKEAADNTKEKLDAAGYETAIVRVQR